MIRLPDPLTQSAELQIRTGPSLITRARRPGPTLNEQVAWPVETTLRLNDGVWPRPNVACGTNTLSTTSGRAQNAGVNVKGPDGRADAPGEGATPVLAVCRGLDRDTAPLPDP